VRSPAGKRSLADGFDRCSKGLVAKGVITAQRNRSVEKGDQATTYSLRMHGHQSAGADKAHEAEEAHADDTGETEQRGTETGKESRGERGGYEESSSETFYRGSATPSDPPLDTLSAAPVTENRHGGIPVSGKARYRQSATQETVPQQTDDSVRNSRVSHEESQSQEERQDDSQTKGSGHPHQIDQKDGVHQPKPYLQPQPQPKPQERSGSLRSLAQVLAAHQAKSTTMTATTAVGEPGQYRTLAAPTLAIQQPLRQRSRYGRIKPTPQVAVAVTEIAQEFGDLRHLGANCTQAMRLWESSRRDESNFVGVLYEARAITKQQPRVANRMSYFWTVLRDLLDLLDTHESPPLRQQVGPTK
jgi:hypothetical protein